MPSTPLDDPAPSARPVAPRRSGRTSSPQGNPKAHPEPLEARRCRMRSPQAAPNDARGPPVSPRRTAHTHALKIGSSAKDMIDTQRRRRGRTRPRTGSGGSPRGGSLPGPHSSQHTAGSDFSALEQSDSECSTHSISHGRRVRGGAGAGAERASLRTASDARLARPRRRGLFAFGPPGTRASSPPPPRPLGDGSTPLAARPGRARAGRAAAPAARSAHASASQQLHSAASPVGRRRPKRLGPPASCSGAWGLRPPPH